MAVQPENVPTARAETDLLLDRGRTFCRLSRMQTRQLVRPATRNVANSTRSRLVPVMRRLVQRPKHFISERRGHYDSRRDGSFIIMLHQLVFQPELWPHVSKRFQLRIQLDVGRLESCSTFQSISDERFCTVSTLCSEPVGPSFQIIDLRVGQTKNGTPLAR